MGKRNIRILQHTIQRTHTEAYAHPNGPILQITPYKGPHRTEFDIRTFLEEEPKKQNNKNARKNYL